MTPSFVLPPVELVRPGLWSVPVPLPMSGINYVLVYVFATDRGPFLIDAGWDTPEALDALSEGLSGIGMNIADVRGVLVTHVHQDHYGLAPRIRSLSGAWVGLHAMDAAQIRRRAVASIDEMEDRLQIELLELGAPAGVIKALAEQSAANVGSFPRDLPDMELEDGEKPPVPNWDLVSIWTPGHSPGHVCFYSPRERLLFSGDHILPRITPNISKFLHTDVDPLGDYLDSLRRVSEMEVDEVLPAHQYRFVGLPARVSELLAHHALRLSQTVALVDAGVETAWSIAEGMSWSRSWSEMGPHLHRQAVAETNAHLAYLVRRGVLAEREGVPLRWEVVHGESSEHFSALLDTLTS